MPSTPDTPHGGSSRRDFFKNTAALGFGLAAGALPLGAAAAGAGKSDGRPDSIRPRPPGAQSVFDLTTEPREKIRAAFIGLNRGRSHVRDAALLDWVEITALCDIRKDRVDKAAETVGQSGNGGAVPALYHGAEDAWEKLVARDDIDVVYISTPWEWHAAMAVQAMEHGKHAFVEVSSALNVDEGWKLIDTAERTRRHCAILENCCYGENELFVRNLVRHGVFGDIVHGECAYIHDLRDMLFRLDTEGDWRREYHKKLDGNLYPTHGLGPVALYMDIARGDRLKYLVSVSSGEHGLGGYLREKNPNGGRHAGEKYRCGDINTTLIKTERGRSIMVQHDVVSPRPYTRINALSGTGATFFDFPARLALNDPAAHGVETSSHDWLRPAEMQKMRDRFTHPLIRALREKSRGGGHGGMDFVMNHRMLDTLRKGEPMDLTVYDAAIWSSIIELSAASVAAGSAPVPIPDFTRGGWATNKARL